MAPQNPQKPRIFLGFEPWKPSKHIKISQKQLILSKIKEIHKILQNSKKNCWKSIIFDLKINKKQMFFININENSWKINKTMKTLKTKYIR